MMSSPKISIIMPAYGVEKYIGPAIECVMEQSFSDWELIVVIDGSKDNSAAIAKGYTAKDPRISVYEKPNGGLSDARNYGLKYAKGEFVHFFDSDDRISQDFYQSMLEESDGADIVIYGYDVIYEEAGKENAIEKRIIDNSAFNSQYGYRLLEFVCYAWNKLFRLEFLKKHNLLYEVGLYRVEDVEFMSRVIRYSPKVKFVPYASYQYVQRDEATLSKGFDSKIIDFNSRRIGFDFAMLVFFGKIQESYKDAAKNFLKSRALIATINRLYSSSIDKKDRRKYLEEMQSLMPTKFIGLNGRGIKGIFDYLTYLSMSTRQYFIIDILQQIRK